MTEQQARKVADAVIAVAVVGAAIVVLRSPKLRRMKRSCVSCLGQ